MGIPGSANPMLFGRAAAYQINQSLRFNSADSAYLNRTPASAGNRKTWTWSGWVKRCTFGSVDNCLFSAYGNGTQSAGIYFSNDVQNDSLEVRFGPYSGGWQGYLVTAQVFRDPSAWYHIVFAADTTQATASDRLKLYVNGSQVTTFNSSAYPSQNADGFLNQAQEHQIGRLQGNTYYHDGYLAEVNFIDGTALTPSSFGETDTITGAWIPKKYSGSYGTNGFYLKFEGSGIGTDSSGNGNTWTASGFSTSGTGTDVMSDTPTNNWCTLNPLIPSYQGSPTYSEGNLQVQMSGGGQGGVASQAVTTGKWYAEITISNAGNRPIVGICPSPNTLAPDRITPFEGVGYYYDGTKYVSNSGSSYGSSWTTNDIIGIALDLDSGTKTVTFYKNNTSQGAITLPSNSGFWLFCSAGSGSDGNGTFLHNFGQRAFAYTPPTGFKALNTANLPEPTIKKGSKYMDVLTWSGTGGGSGATRSLTGLGFSPDFVWGKIRTSSSPGHILMDAVRGVGTGKYLQSNTTNAEGTSGPNEALYGYLSSLDSAGFTVTNGTSTFDNWNKSGDTYVAWAWDANGAGSSNTAGTITSTVSANPTAGFSIVTYTGNGTSGATVGHGLGVKPSFLIVRRRPTTSNWTVYHSSVGATKRLVLDSTNNATTGTGFWNDTEPTSTVFTIGNDGGTNSTTDNTYVAYCFSEVAGYSKFGYYAASGQTFVYTGFAPAFVMIKALESANWVIFDRKRSPYNKADDQLSPNSSIAEVTNDGDLNFLSNGFKLLSGAATTNAYTYVYAAFSETAFKYSNAR